MIKSDLKNKNIAIVGLGYVGLPLAVEFGKNYSVVGFDLHHERIEELRNGIDKTREVNPNEINEAQGLKFTTKLEDLKGLDIYIVTVPTPIDEFNAPDLNPLTKASKMIGQVMQKGAVVIYESTVYPGCTEEVCVPILEEESGLSFNSDFYCGYSPERINPGDKDHRLTDIKKITSGSNPEVANFVDNLYASIIKAGTHKTKSIKIAEAAKVIENSQRDLNIAFVNELALIFDKVGIDTSEVLQAAETKWNFLPFRPGLVGGHCIGVDPYYLTHKAESIGYHPQVILAGRRINDNMGIHIANKVIKLITHNDKKVKGANILILGITFKENCPDIRNSRVIDVIKELESFGASVKVHDPIADNIEVKKEYCLELWDQLDEKFDAIILAVAHQQFQDMKWEKIADEKTVIYDVKSVLDKGLVSGRL